MFFGFLFFWEGWQFVVEVDQVLVVFGLVVEEVEFFGDGGLGFGGGGFKWEWGVGYNSFYGGVWLVDWLWGKVGQLCLCDQ